MIKGIEFFKPDRKFVEWIYKYAGDRMIIDAGCGEYFPLTQKLVDVGANVVVAIDKYIAYEFSVDFRLSINDPFKSIHILEQDILSLSALYTGGKEVLMIFARPCHSDFVARVLDIKGKNTEVLYITVPENIRKYNDLEHHEADAVLLEHEGFSVDNEVVYSIK